MKLIVAGATGLIGTEIIRQAISNKAIDTVLALGRRETAAPGNLPPGGDPSKLKSVVCSDFTNYSDDVKSQLEGADACIWMLAITPSAARNMAPEEVRKICVDYPLVGIEALKQLPRGKDGKPLRFVYASGAMTERDQTKKPWMLADYVLMRGLTETKVLEAAAESDGEVAAAILKIGLVQSSSTGFVTGMIRSAIGPLLGIPTVDVEDVAAASLDLATRKSFDKDTYVNDDLVQIGQAYKRQQEE